MVIVKRFVLGSISFWCLFCSIPSAFAVPTYYSSGYSYDEFYTTPSDATSVYGVGDIVEGLSWEQAQSNTWGNSVEIPEWWDPIELWIYQDESDLYWNWRQRSNGNYRSSIPEPSTITLLGFGLVMLKLRKMIK